MRLTTEHLLNTLDKMDLLDLGLPGDWDGDLDEHDVLEALGDYECDAGISVENVPAVANIKRLKGRFIEHKFSTGWTVGVEKSGKEEECCWPFCSQV